MIFHLLKLITTVEQFSVAALCDESCGFLHQLRVYITLQFVQIQVQSHISWLSLLTLVEASSFFARILLHFMIVLYYCNRVSSIHWLKRRLRLFIERIIQALAAGDESRLLGSLFHLKDQFIQVIFHLNASINV